MRNPEEEVRQLMDLFGCRTQAELGELLGVGQQAVTNWLRRGMSLRAKVKASREAERRGLALSIHTLGKSPSEAA